MFGSILKYFFILIFFILICFSGLVFSLDSIDSFNFVDYEIENDIISSELDFVWPTPGYKTITSPFGYRVAPTTGAGTYHGGIDIGAPTGCPILSAFSGKVTYIGFMRS